MFARNFLKEASSALQVKPGWSTGLFVALGAGLIVLVTYSNNAGPDSHRITATNLLLAGGWTAVGGVVGFLFGVPRTLQGTEAPTTAGSEATPKQARARYAANTNLEQISDWLTKILVGVGLTQIGALPEHLYALSQFVGPAMGDGPTARVLAIGSFLYFSAVGFMFGYLWTRLLLVGAMARSDRAALEERIAQLDEKLDADARALAVVSRHLDETRPVTEAEKAQVREAIAAASGPTRARIFYQAAEVRRESWRDSAKRPRMERTIPIFRALIELDEDRKFHMNHGQLGFALKDQHRPAWSEAEKELTEAIRIRGPWQQNGWVLYEFNRAVCRMQLDADFRSGRPTQDPISRSAIVEDLSAVATLTENKYLLESPVVDWLKLNGITPESLAK